MHQEEKKMKKIKKKKEKESKKLKTITEDNKTECLYWEGTFENQSIEVIHITFFVYMKPMYNKNFIIYKTETENKSLLPSYQWPDQP